MPCTVGEFKPVFTETSSHNDLTQVAPSLGLPSQQVWTHTHVFQEHNVSEIGYGQELSLLSGFMTLQHRRMKTVSPPSVRPRFGLQPLLVAPVVVARTNEPSQDRVVAQPFSEITGKFFRRKSPASEPMNPVADQLLPRKILQFA